MCAFTVRVCVHLGWIKAHLGFFPPPYCKFLDGRQTRAILIALGSLRWLFQLLSLDTAPLNLSSAKINYTILYAFTGCSLWTPKGRLNHAQDFHSALYFMFSPSSLFYLMLYQLAVQSVTQINCCKTSPFISLVPLFIIVSGRYPILQKHTSFWWNVFFFFHFLVYLYFLKLPSASPWRHQIKTQDQQETPLWNSSRYYNTNSTERLRFYHDVYDNQNIIVLILVSFDRFSFNHFASLSSRKWQHIKDSCQNSCISTVDALVVNNKTLHTVFLCSLLIIFDWLGSTRIPGGWHYVESCHLETSLMPVWLWGSLKGF